MGFHVGITQDDHHLLRTLRSNPAEVFEQPYAGYLFFLVGSADTEALEWLKKNLVSLDSLTGDHIAYALFAERVPLSLHVTTRADRPPRHLGEIPVRDVHHLQKILKRGSRGWVVDGDYIDAVTYGTDHVARAFGVMRDLPCVLVLDAFATDAVEVIRLDAAALSNLIAVLRQAVHDLTNAPELAEFVAALDVLNRAQRHVEELTMTLRKEEETLVSLPRGDEDAIALALSEELRAKLRAGSMRDFRMIVSKQPEPIRAKLGNVANRAAVDVLMTYRRTIDRVTELRERSWPLSAADAIRCQNVVTRYVARLLPDVRRDDVETPETLDLYLERLSEAQMEIIGELFPPREVITSAIREARAERDSQLEQRIEMLRAELEAVRQRGRNALTSALGAEPPSFRDMIRRGAQQRRLKVNMVTVANKAAAYAGKLLEPQNIAKLLGHAMGA